MGGEVNPFQEMKRQVAAAKESGRDVLDFSIGQPDGILNPKARKAVLKAVKKMKEEYCVYQDNEDLAFPGFAERFVNVHRKTKGGNLDYLTIPGIKPTLMQVILTAKKVSRSENFTVATMPGYGTPKKMAEYLGLNHIDVRLNEYFYIDNWEELKEADLLMLNYPHNPSGQALGTREWKIICDFCNANGIIVFNDAAYAGLTYHSMYCTLTDVAKDYQDMSFCEVFSASKAPCGNGTSLRTGAAVGDFLFMENLKTIKGNMDSGANSFGVAAANGAISSEKVMRAAREKYAKRLDAMLFILKDAGFVPAHYPFAGIFAICELPKRINSQELRSAEEFCAYLFAETGIVTMPMSISGREYIRFTVAQVDTTKRSIQKKFLEKMRHVDISY